MTKKVKTLVIAISSIAALFGYISVTDNEPIFGARTQVDVQVSDTNVNNGTAGSVLFVDSNTKVNQDNSNFYWDDTNNRFGVLWGGAVNTAFEVGGVASVGTNLNVGEVSTATTSIVFETRASNKGVCIVMTDSAGTVRYMRLFGNTLTVNTTDCQ